MRTPELSTLRLLAFIVTAVVVIVIPGPSVLFIVARALASGRRVAILSVLGNTAGEYAQVVAIAFGLGTIAERSVAAFTIFKVAGGLYLLYLGIKTFRERKALGALVMGAGERPQTGTRALLQGLTVGLTNPKTMIFMAAILPQFVVRGAPGVPDQILVLGVIFSAIAIVSDSVWALLADAFRSWFGRSPRRLELVGGTGGLAIMAVGAGLLLTGRKS